jgi:hypothetical protein
MPNTLKRLVLKRLIKVASAFCVSWIVLLLTAWWADQNPAVAAFFGSHNIVFQLFVTLPLVYFLLGQIPVLRTSLRATGA